MLGLALATLAFAPFPASGPEKSTYSTGSSSPPSPKKLCKEGWHKGMSDAFSSYDYDDSPDAKSGIACWDVSLIKDFGRAFESLQPDYCWGCGDDDIGRFTGDISKWDVSQGTLTSDTILT